MATEVKQGEATTIFKALGWRRIDLNWISNTVKLEIPPPGWNEITKFPCGSGFSA